MITEVKDNELVVITYDLLVGALIVIVALTVFSFFQSPANLPIGLVATIVTGIIVMVWRTIFEQVR